jgi:hypothetical protein
MSICGRRLSASWEKSPGGIPHNARKCAKTFFQLPGRKVRGLFARLLRLSLDSNQQLHLSFQAATHLEGCMPGRKIHESKSLRGRFCINRPWGKRPAVDTIIAQNVFPALLSGDEK